MVAYYNENDPKAAAWLRELIREGLIANGEVDERSIEDIRPRELTQYTQCHFFAGIGGWSYALRCAGWKDDRRVWTGSCPCQPFSAAGKGSGIVDERHLWPAWFHLIEQCRPPLLFGEQVSSKSALSWIDLVQADLEGADYACQAFDLCAAGVGAPHIRQRLYFVADTNGGNARTQWAQRSGEHGQLTQDGSAGSLEHAESVGRQQRRTESSGRSTVGGCGESGMEHLKSEQMEVPGRARKPRSAGTVGDTNEQQLDGCRDLWSRRRRESSNAGFWDNCEWIECTDGKARPIEPGTFPLAHGVPGRVGFLRGYGNAIVAPLAEAFIEAYMSCND